MELVGNRKCASAVQARHLPTVSTMMYKREKYRGDRLARRGACLISFTLVQTRGRRARGERGGGCHDGVGGLEASEAEATLDARNTINSAATAGGCEVGRRAGCMHDIAQLTNGLAEKVRDALIVR